MCSSHGAQKKYTLLNLRDVEHLQLKNAELSSINYSDKRHICIALIVHLQREIHNITRRSIFKRYIHDNYKDYIDKLNNVIEPRYKTLPTHRHWGINTNIGCFNLARNSLNNLTISEVLWYHWEYYSYSCPLWKERFDKYNIIVDHVKKSIVFKDIDQEEEFYEKYYYEPGEQTQETQDCSICNIPPIGYYDWLKTIKN